MKEWTKGDKPKESGFYWVKVKYAGSQTYFLYLLRYEKYVCSWFEGSEKGYWTITHYMPIERPELPEE